VSKKKTKAQLDYEAAEERAQRQLRVVGALRWSDYSVPEPDVKPPSIGQGSTLTEGWMFNVHTQRVFVACSSASGHALNRVDQTTSQGSLALYSTRVRALRALRCAMEQAFAEQLDRIDVQIAKAEEPQ
jgi:hypothetical protein